MIPIRANTPSIATKPSGEPVNNRAATTPISPKGAMTIDDGISAPGDHVELRAEMDVLCVISNCPQINNPCNGFDPTPVRVLVWEGEDA